MRRHGSCLESHVLAWIASGWLLGLFIGAQANTPAASIPLAVSLFGAWTLVLHGGHAHARSWRLVLGVLACCCGVGASHPAARRCRASGEHTVVARAVSLRYRAEDVRVRLTTSDGTSIDARMATVDAPPPNSTVSFVASLRPRTHLENPSPHPGLFPKRANACWARVRTGTLRVVKVPAWRHHLHALRQRVRAHLVDTVDPDTSAVARALVLGDGGALPYERRRTVAAVGLAHLFAVSGLHVALVSGTVVMLLRFLMRGAALSFDARRLAAGLGVPLAVLHAMFAGGAPSAWRAAATAAVTWSFVAFGKRSSPVPVTAAVVLLMSGPDPAMALRPAFLLSIVSTSAILSAPSVRAPWRRLRGAAVISGRTLVATAPMVWWWFGGVPLIGWLANLVVLPFGSWVVIPLAHAVALSSWLPSMRSPTAAALEWAVRLLLDACSRLSALAVTQELPPLDAAQGLIVLGGCIALLCLRSWRARFLTAMVASALWLAEDAALVRREQPRESLRVTFVDVGQGDAALIDLPDGRLALIDTGQGDRHPAARELERLLLARRRGRIDVLALTHGHPDHMGGFDRLLDRFPIAELWISGQRLVEEPGGAFESSVNRALQTGTRVRFAHELCATPKDLGGAQIELLWPCPRYEPAFDLNDNSLVMALQYGEVRFLFTGDIESEAEQRLVASGRVSRVEVLKVAHHGSRTSSTTGFVDAASPEWAVISSGSGNRYGHPARSVLRRLRDSGARVWRTDLEGGLILRTNGTRVVREH